MSEKPILVGTYLYANAFGPDDMFGVYRVGDKYYWEFCSIWKWAGPFNSELEAITAGKKELNPDGTHYFSDGDHDRKEKV